MHRKPSERAPRHTVAAAADTSRPRGLEAPPPGGLVPRNRCVVGGLVPRNGCADRWFRTARRLRALRWLRTARPLRVSGGSPPPGAPRYLVTSRSSSSPISSGSRPGVLMSNLMIAKRKTA